LRRWAGLPRDAGRPRAAAQPDAALRGLLGPEIREVAREGFEWLCAEIARLSGASGQQLQDFIAKGMLLNVAASMDFPAIGDSASW